jgi:hypothetical protein
MKFHGDPELALPEGSQWGDIGKNDFSLYVVFGNLIMNFLCYVSETNQDLSKCMWHLSGLQDHLLSRDMER